MDDLFVGWHFGVTPGKKKSPTVTCRAFLFQQQRITNRA
jgi:hypothetical protein